MSYRGGHAFCGQYFPGLFDAGEATCQRNVVDLCFDFQRSRPFNVGKMVTASFQDVLWRATGFRRALHSSGYRPRPGSKSVAVSDAWTEVLSVRAPGFDAASRKPCQHQRFQA